MSGIKSFWDLPAEIRNMVYQQALIHEGAIEAGSRYCKEARTNLPFSSRIIRDECDQMFFSQNTFVFDLDTAHQTSQPYLPPEPASVARIVAAKKWLCATEPRCLAAIRHFRIRKHLPSVFNSRRSLGAEVAIGLDILIRKDFANMDISFFQTISTIGDTSSKDDTVLCPRYSDLHHSVEELIPKAIVALLGGNLNVYTLPFHKILSHAECRKLCFCRRVVVSWFEAFQADESRRRRRTDNHGLSKDDFLDLLGCARRSYHDHLGNRSMI